MGPSGRVYSCTCLMRLMLGQVVVLVELPVQRRLSDFRERCRVTRYSRVFCGLTGCQRDPRFWGVTALYQSLCIRIPRELGFGYS